MNLLVKQSRLTDIRNKLMVMKGEHGGEYKSAAWDEYLYTQLESPLDCKEIQPVHPKGDQPWVFIGRTDGEAETPVLWPPHAKC